LGSHGFAANAAAAGGLLLALLTSEVMRYRPFKMQLFGILPGTAGAAPSANLQYLKNRQDGKILEPRAVTAHLHEFLLKVRSTPTMQVLLRQSRLHRQTQAQGCAGLQRF